MKIEFEIDKGDYLIINEKRWEVCEEPGETVALDPIIGESMEFDKESIEEMIRYSSSFRFYTKEYLSTKDF
jgi:hypothetical protein